MLCGRRQHLFAQRPVGQRMLSHMPGGNRRKLAGDWSWSKKEGKERRLIHHNHDSDASNLSSLPHSALPEKPNERAGLNGHPDLR